MRRKDGIAFLMREGYGRVPCSRYGRNTEECAPVAWRMAYLFARETGTELDEERLDFAMGLVVNDHDDVAYIIRSYGNYKYV